jgi:hypothetical protein
MPASQTRDRFSGYACTLMQEYHCVCVCVCVCLSPYSLHHTFTRHTLMAMPRKHTRGSNLALATCTTSSPFPCDDGRMRSLHMRTLYTRELPRMHSPVVCLQPCSADDTTCEDCTPAPGQCGVTRRCGSTPKPRPPCSITARGGPARTARAARLSSPLRCMPHAVPCFVPRRRSMCTIAACLSSRSPPPTPRKTSLRGNPRLHFNPTFLRAFGRANTRQRAMEIQHHPPPRSPSPSSLLLQVLGRTQCQVPSSVTPRSKRKFRETACGGQGQ